MRVLLFSSLYPSVVRPRHGIFVETRLRQLLREGGVDACVIAPVPWFPFRHPVFGAYAAFAATPRRDRREGGIDVSYPRYLMLPRLGVAFQPDSMARGALGDARSLVRAGWVPDLIDAHYLYPDGVAAALLAQRLQRPFVMTARGTDVNVIARQSGPGRRVLWAARRAAAIFTVAAPLRDTLVQIGVDPAKIVVLRNGVDPELFRPEDPLVARQRLGLPSGPLVGCVGNLVPEKGQALAIDALAHLPGHTLVLVGDGPQRPSLAAQVQRRGLEARVRFVPAMPQRELRWLYSALDVLLLTSLREGWPNVVLESLACGTPVAAVAVGAVGDMLTTPKVGRIVASRDEVAFAAAVATMTAEPTDREAVRRHSASFDWSSTSRGQMDLFARVIAEHRATARLPS